MTNKNKEQLKMPHLPWAVSPPTFVMGLWFFSSPRMARTELSLVRQKGSCMPLCNKELLSAIPSQDILLSPTHCATPGCDVVGCRSQKTRNLCHFKRILRRFWNGRTAFLRRKWRRIRVAVLFLWRFSPVTVDSKYPFLLCNLRAVRYFESNLFSVAFYFWKNIPTHSTRPLQEQRGHEGNRSASPECVRP
jgi:hypothetical protein